MSVGSYTGFVTLVVALVDQAYIALHRCYKLLPLTIDADGEDQTQLA